MPLIWSLTTNSRMLCGRARLSSWRCGTPGRLRLSSSIDHSATLFARWWSGANEPDGRIGLPSCPPRTRRHRRRSSSCGISFVRASTSMPLTTLRKEWATASAVHSCPSGICRSAGDIISAMPASSSKSSRRSSKTAVTKASRAEKSRGSSAKGSRSLQPRVTEAMGDDHRELPEWIVKRIKTSKQVLRQLKDLRGRTLKTYKGLDNKGI